MPMSPRVSSTIDEEFRETLARVGDEFQTNELAYLATTTKIELPLRDRLAYILHRQFEPHGVLVAREWRRTDLAMLTPDGNPICLVELKAMYTFDAFGENLYFFTRAMTADEQKARLLAARDTLVYTLLLATHLDGSVEPRFSGIVKYDRGINRGVAAHGSAQALQEVAVQNVRSALAERDVVAEGTLPGGEAFGRRVDVLYWLVRQRSPDAVAP
jgi:hypothetical protein